MKRSDLYDRMSRDLDEHGPRFLEAGATSQSLSLSDIFSLKDGSVVPILKARLCFAFLLIYFYIS